VRGKFKNRTLCKMREECGTHPEPVPQLGCSTRPKTGATQVTCGAVSLKRQMENQLTTRLQLRNELLS
jgi:hypothetical protein